MGFRISGQNWADTIFSGPRLHCCTKFGNNSRTVGRLVKPISPPYFSSNFIIELVIFAKIFKTSKIDEKSFIIGPFFSSVLSNSFSLNETAIGWIFEVAEFESLVKIERRPAFLGALGNIIAQKLGITQEQFVVRAHRSHCRIFSRISRRIFENVENCQKWKL